MADRPITFSPAMVRALLAGTKTQTRRHLDAWCEEPPAIVEDGIVTAFDENYRPYRWPNTKAVGDRLYVREHWHTNSSEDGKSPRDIDPSEFIWYVADGEGNMPISRFRQAMHMPKWASRLTLHVTEVRVQRLQDISEEDALAEGIVPMNDLPGVSFGVRLSDDTWAAGPTAVSAYSVLFATVNGDTDALVGESLWDKNPWVAAYTFVVEKVNIDQARAA